MKFVHPISDCAEKKFSKIVDDVWRAMAEVNRKQTLPCKEHYQEQRAACDTYIIREIEGFAHETMCSTANPISFTLPFMDKCKS